MALHSDSGRSTAVCRRRVLGTVAGLGLASLASVPASGQQNDGGTELWRFETEDWVTASATVVDGTVYTGSFDNHVYALDAETGRQEWRYGTERSVAWAPAVVDRSDGDGRELFVGTNSRLYGLDADAGTREWRTDADAGLQVGSPSVLGENVVFNASNVGAVDRGDGDWQWRTLTRGSQIPGWLQLKNSSPTVVPAARLGEYADEDVIFVGSSDGNLNALGPGPENKQGVYERGGPIISSPTFDDGTVYFGSFDGRLYAKELGEAGDRWRFRTEDRIISSPTVHEGTVFVGSGDGSVYAVDTESGDERWSFDTDGSVHSSPTVVGGTVFVGSDDSHVYALAADSGQEVWRYDTGNLVRSSPIVVDGVVFVGGWNGSVYALTAGVEGSSEGTRVELGTLGHHHDHARYGDGAQEISPAVDGAVHTPEENEPEGSDENADDDGAGFGIAATLGGLGGASYLLARSLGDEPDEN